MLSKSFIAIATLTGTVIGAGFLGIPYVVSKSGFFIGLIHMIILAIVMMVINLMMAEIVLSSKAIHHISGYASKYLGKKTKIFIFIASAIGLYSALVAYILGEGESLSFIFSGNLIYSLIAGIVFWVIISLLTSKGIRSFRKIEPIAVILIFLITIFIGIIYFNKIDLSNLSYSDSKFIFLPFGVVLFSFLGVSSIPEVRRVLKNKEKLMKRCIIIGSLIPLIVYVVFSFIVLGVYGTNVQEIATLSLGKVVALLGIITMFSAFLSLNLALQDSLRFDFLFREKSAWFFASIIPGLIFIIIKIFDFAGFVKILSFGGTISGGLLSIAILLIHEHLRDKKLHRKPEFRINLSLIVKFILIAIFVLGIIYEFL